jgi:hypothetical protein
MSSVLSNGPHVFDVYDSIIHQQYDFLVKLNPDQRNKVFAMMEDDMRAHIEFMWNVVNTVEGVPIEYIELCLMMDNVMKALYGNIEILSGGKRKRRNTRKRGGKHGGTRRNTNIEKSWSLMSSVLGKLALVTGVALSAYAGSSAANSAVNETAYYTAKTTGYLKNLLPEFIIGQQPIDSNVIPAPLMDLAVEYNYKQIHTPPITLDVNTSPLVIFDSKQLELLQEITGQTFSNHVTELLGDDIITEEFPKIQESVNRAVAASEANLTTCKSSVPVWKILGDPCKIEKAQYDLEKERQQSMESLGYKLTPGNTLTAKHHSIQAATVGIADGVHQVLKLQGDIEGATAIENMLTTFQGYKGIGLKEGSGRFAPNLLLTKQGVDNAISTCADAIRSAKCGESCREMNPIVSKIENILNDVCEIQVNTYAQTAFANNVARKTGDDMVNKIVSIEDSKRKGFNRMIQYFETKSNMESSPEQRDMYTKIKQNLHFMNLKNIMFPTDPTEVSSWISAIESHYIGYLKAGIKNVEALSTREFRDRLAAKDMSSTWTIALGGGIAGAAISVALLGLLQALWYSATGAIYATGAIGKYMKNVYDAQVRKGALSNQLDKAMAEQIKLAHTPQELALVRALVTGSNIQSPKNAPMVVNKTNAPLAAIQNISGGYKRSIKRKSYKGPRVVKK